MSAFLSLAGGLLVVLTALGLAAAAGLRVFLPLFLAGLAARLGWLPLHENFLWLDSGMALAVFGLASLVEIASYHVPVVDNFLDTIAVPAAAIAGAVVSLAVLADGEPWLRWSLAVIAGSGLATSIRVPVAGVRAASTVATVGLGNQLLALAESVAATVLSFLAVLLPLAVLPLLVLLLVTLVLLVRHFPPPAPRPATISAMSTTTTTLDTDAVRDFVAQVWDESILPELIEYVRIPNKSPHFDPDWKANGHMDRAADQIEAWCKARPIPGLVVERVQLEGRTPLLYMEVPGASDAETVLLYGHFDKQPEMTGWREDLGPWIPKVEDDKLYGRGGADDGYAAFASLTALEALHRQGIPHARCVLLIEGCEESGSYDLPFYLEHLRDRIGTPNLVVCLDSGCGDYDRLWNTTSLRGMVGGTLSVKILDEGVHSGDASGVVPDSFRIARDVLSRLEDATTGRIVPRRCTSRSPRIDAAKPSAPARSWATRSGPSSRSTKPRGRWATRSPSASWPARGVPPSP